MTTTHMSYELARVQDQGIGWTFTRHCAVSPRQLLALYIAACVVLQVIGLGFWILGATPILGFAWLELLAVGLGFWMYARHAGDQERIVLEGSRLLIERTEAGQLHRSEFDGHWVQLGWSQDPQPLLEIRAHGQSTRVGQHVLPRLRPILAREIRCALQHLNPLAPWAATQGRAA